MMRCRRFALGVAACGLLVGCSGKQPDAVVPAAAITLSASSLAFTTAAESTSAAQVVTVSNSGTAALGLSGVALSGLNAVNFAETDNCGSSLAVGASCAVQVTFTPSIAAGFAAKVTVTSSVGAPVVALSGTGTGTLSIVATNPTDWVISNGGLVLDWNSTNGRMFGVHLVGHPENLVDVNTTNGGQPLGLYMGNVGTGLAGAPTTASFVQSGNAYIDWWISTASNATNGFTTSQHFILTANDTGFHAYSTALHGASDIAGDIGQWQYIFRINTSLFNETYSVDTGLGNLGAIDVPLPDPSVYGTTDPGRQVQNAAVDLHGLTVPAGFTRQFFTKYDYQGTEYLHREHGVYGTKYGSWMVLPSAESLVGGPTKQNLIFTENILMMEALSGHLVNALSYAPVQGITQNRLFGPYYFHFNAFTAANSTPASLFKEASTYLPSFNYLYDMDATLQTNGYVATAGRGVVAPAIAGVASATANTAWVVLSDSAKNFQYSTAGRQYWVSENAAGSVSLSGVVPGNYRLSAYVLGQWGELRQDNVAVAAGATTAATGTFTPENFGTAAAVWTIGTADRSAHEFLHGRDAAGNDLRNFYGAYNYWQDFAATSGGQVYYATAVGSTPATNDLNKLNYMQWGKFNPGLYAGIYNASDDTTDGYKYIVPAYVGDPSVASIPATTVHFTTNAAQLAQGQYAVLSVGLACVEASLTVSLNGHPLVWHYLNASDCMIRSGVSGYYQWVAYQWNTSQLNAAGADNVLTFSVSQPDGVMLDAMRFEITNKSADPAVTGWHDYEYLYGSTYVGANDAVPSN